MKQLQNNFTTPEQSKRLIELGVPADSADFYIYGYGQKWQTPIILIDKPISFNDTKANFLPIWSVGRLIEVYCTCRECTWEYITNNPPIEDILCDIELYIEEMDFSKLED